MYLALARKYRPRTFDEIVGQDYIIRALKNAVRLGRIHHAYLFCGTRGVGKTTAARILARAINCDSELEPPCNHCETCIEIIEGKSLDIMEIDGASNRRIDDARDLREKVRVAPVRAKYKVYIIDEVHMLTTEAFNALLKTLEEPPPNVIFVFATTEPEKVPQTILSRCQRFDFRRVSAQVVSEHLASVLDREKISYEEAALGMIAWTGAGSVRDALSLLDMVLAFSENTVSVEETRNLLGFNSSEKYPDLLMASSRGELKATHQVLREILGKESSVLTFLKGYIGFLKAVLEGKVVGSVNKIEFPFVSQDVLEKIVRTVDISYLEISMKNLINGYEYCRNSGFPETVVEFLFFQLARHAVSPETIEDITRKMMELYYKLDSGDRGGIEPVQTANIVAAPKSPGRVSLAGGDFRDSSGLRENIDTFLSELDKIDSQLRAWFNPLDYELNGKEIVFRVVSERHRKTIEENREKFEPLQEKYLNGFRILVQSITEEPGGQRDKSAPEPSRVKKKEKDPMVEDLLSILGGEIVDGDG